ncbi:MAG: NCS2 family permease [Alphaproteobacteria bacterium]|nr:NCS2 family permease [Alphaproteobacteria bacterium]
MLEKLFHLNKLNTSVKTEVLAGITTFLTMSYIIFVNPALLSKTGMDASAVFVATCLAATIGSMAMGLIANYPLALAPGMGINAFFTFGIVMGMGLSWQQGLGAVFISGIFFFSLSVTKVRETLINSIPRTLKMGIAGGIGFFLAIIGLKTSGIVVDNPATLVGLGNLKDPKVLLAVFGILLTAGLYVRNITGSVIISILTITIISIATGLSEFNGVFSMPPSIAPTFMQLEIPDLFSVSTLALVVSLLLLDLFDTSGTLIAATERAGLVDKNGKLPRLKQTLLADSTSTMIGSFLGTSTVTTYTESMSGVLVGGRTGLTSVVVGICFLLALFLSPLAGTIPAYATSPALVFVACLMAPSLKDINWDDITDYAPSVITVITMPLTFSVVDGIGFGFISYTVIKLIAGRHKEVSLAMYLLTAIFLMKYSFL